MSGDQVERMGIVRKPRGADLPAWGGFCGRPGPWRRSLSKHRARTAVHSRRAPPDSTAHTVRVNRVNRLGCEVYLINHLKSANSFPHAYFLWKTRTPPQTPRPSVHEGAAWRTPPERPPSTALARRLVATSGGEGSSAFQDRGAGLVLTTMFSRSARVRPLQPLCPFTWKISKVSAARAPSPGLRGESA